MGSKLLSKFFPTQKDRVRRNIVYLEVNGKKRKCLIVTKVMDIQLWETVSRQDQLRQHTKSDRGGR